MMTDVRINNEKPLEEQLATQLKKAVMRFYKSAKLFYVDMNRYHYRNYDN